MFDYKKFLNRRILIICTLLVFLILGYRYLYKAPHRNYCDFRVYYQTARVFLEKGDIYSRPDESVTPFKYSPFFAFLIAPLGLFPIKAAAFSFFTVSFISLIVIVHFSMRLIVNKNLSPNYILVLIAGPVVFSFRFILGVIDSGQVALMMMALITLGLYYVEQGKEIKGAMVLAISIMFKYMSVIFIPYFILRRKFKAALAMIIFSVLYCFLPSVFLGFNKVLEYLKDWLPFISQTSFDRGSWLDYKNQSLYSTIARYFSNDYHYRNVTHSLGWWTLEQSLFVGAVGGILLYMATLWPRFVKTNHRQIRMAEYGLLFILMVILNPNAWTFNFVYSLFPVMVIWHHLMECRFRDLTVFIVLAAAFLLSSGGSSSLVGKVLQKHFEILSLTNFAMLCLMFLLFKFKYSASMQNEPAKKSSA